MTQEPNQVLETTSPGMNPQPDVNNHAPAKDQSGL